MLQISLVKQFAILVTCALGLFWAVPNAFYSRVETHNDAQAVIDSGLTTPELEEDAAVWPGVLPSKLVNLGLDLRGGAHLLAEVQVTDVYANILSGLWPEIRDALAAERDTVGFVTREESSPDLLVIRISEVAGVERALELVRGLAQPVVSLTGAGASNIEVSANGPLLTVALSAAEKIATDERTMAQSLEIIRRRIDAAGTREPSIVRQGEDRILIQVPGAKSAQELKGWIGATAQLSFNPVVGRTTDANTVPGSGNVLLPSVEDEGAFYIIERTPVVTGEMLTNAAPAFDPNGRPAVNFQFNVTGARKFGDYTAENVGSLFAIVLDDEVISAPTIQDHIPGGAGIISGTFTLEEATNLAVLLRAGALPAKLVFVEERTIGPELGQDSIDAGKWAALAGLASVILFMVATYGWFGVLASLALLVNVGLIFGLLSIVGATLTLPGIAGIVLTMGMAVDANVLVFERIREELRTAKGPARAIQLGYERALSAIVDSNITTLMTAAILYFVGSGPVKGFAITLGFGIITSVFTAVYVTRLFIVWWFQIRRPKTIEV